MTNNSISNEAALAILNDFDWHHRREFIPLARHITPETACRAYVNAVPVKQRTTRTNTVLDIKIRGGRSRIVDEYIYDLKRRQFIEVIGTKLEKQIRLIRRAYIDHRGRLIGDLTRCPCCDGKPALIDVIRFDAREFRAECENCHLGLSGGDKQIVIDAWNNNSNSRRQPAIIKDTTEIVRLQELNEDLTRQCAELNAALAEATTERDEILTAMQQFAPIIVR